MTPVPHICYHAHGCMNLSLKRELTESMSNAIDLNQSHEFRDANGSVVGYYIPAETRVPGPGSSASASERLERLFHQVAAERDRLRAEAETLREERDVYRNPFTLLRVKNSLLISKPF